MSERQILLERIAGLEELVFDLSDVIATCATVCISDFEGPNHEHTQSDWLKRVIVECNERINK